VSDGGAVLPASGFSYGSVKFAAVSG
jgi:hypothetical protein